MTCIKTAFFLFAIAAQSLIAQDRVLQGQAPAWPPASGKSSFIMSPSRRSQPQSLKELIASSQIVVDATVQRVLPSRVLKHTLETDIVLVANRIMKGPVTLREFVVSQPGVQLAASRKSLLNIL